LICLLHLGTYHVEENVKSLPLLLVVKFFSLLNLFELSYKVIAKLNVNSSFFFVTNLTLSILLDAQVPAVGDEPTQVVQVDSELSSFCKSHELVHQSLLEFVSRAT